MKWNSPHDVQTQVVFAINQSQNIHLQTVISGQERQSLLLVRADHVVEMCFIPCRRDCRLSSWTGWSDCVVTSQRCGVGARQRSRYLIEPNLDGGRDCPPLTDSEV